MKALEKGLYGTALLELQRMIQYRDRDDLNEDEIIWIQGLRKELRQLFDSFEHEEGPDDLDISLFKNVIKGRE